MRRCSNAARVDAIASQFPVVVPTVVLGLVAAVSYSHVVTADTWLALVSGREIAQHGLPSVDHLTVVAQGHSWVDQQWLAQVILYALERVGGVGLVVAVCFLAASVAFVLAASAASRRGASPKAILLFYGAGLAAAPWALEARTQALGLPLFSATLLLLLRDPDAERRSTLWVLPILCLWANVHGSILVGAALVLVYGLRALALGRRRWLAAAFLLAPAAVLASPYAAGLPGYYRMMLFNPRFAREIVEWQRTTPSAGTAVFFALAAAVVALAVLRARRLTTLDAILLATTLAGALLTVRSIVWFSLTALAVASPLATRRASPVPFRGVTVAAMVGLACAVIAGSGAWMATRTYGAGSAAAVRAVREQDRGRRVFADIELADWLLWKLPVLRGRVAYDGRVELLTLRQVGRVLTVVHFTPGWQSVLRPYSLVVTNRAAGTWMATLPGWRRLYSDKRLVVLEQEPRRSTAGGSSRSP